ncbi:uncharacterized protein LOC135366961 [Ornithodoros turicata]|uniref:uncharacterized protein LOC135366961 n=1 Tax=Ornithodoros turicata TaxID=34597 RepID=UPI003138B165
MYAYVRFLFDDARLVVPLTSVKGFSTPADVTDFNGNVNFPVYKVYWAGDQKTRGGYYDAEIIYLAEEGDDARRGGERKRLRSNGRAHGKKDQEVSAKRPAKVVASQNRKTRLNVRRQQELDMLDDLSSDTDDEVVPRALLKEWDEDIRCLKNEIKELRKENMRLQRVLCTKILDAETRLMECQCNKKISPGDTCGIQDTTTHKSVPASGLGLQASRRELGSTASQTRNLLECQAFEPTIVQEESTAATELEQVVSSEIGTVLSVSDEHNVYEDALAEQTSAEGGQAVLETVPTSPLLSEERGDVDIGNGTKIPKFKWDLIHAQDEETKFVKELAVAIWGSEVLAQRTFSGTLSNRARAEGKTQVFPALSPVKVQTLRGAFVNYLTSRKHVKDPGDLKKRTSLMRTYISQKISDLRRRKKT